MLTANRLRDGAVLYWKAGAWVERLAEGEIFATQAEADAALAAAQDFVARNAVVSPYLFDVQDDGSPVKEREIIRAAGPSVRDDLGKQANESTSPSWGGRAGEAGSGGGPRAEPPPGSLRSPTSPSGGDEGLFDVSI
ncbi:MAG TPA: DUF2849 domain-containing protein [Rhizomicrobium sp.]|nr:DUF2849 domain-containing protein [Rhizomicrobium sp.]